jgi:hypothetical protein
MPSPSTALQIIEDALGLTNAVGVDQTLTNDETSDCLRKLNDVIENWSTQKLAVFGQANQTFSTAAGTASYTIGPGGVWNTARPVRIQEPGYTTIQGSSFPVVSINQADYNLIGDKTQTQEYPEVYLFVNDAPLATVTLWPVPNAISPITLSIDRVLTQAATAATVLTFPPGYVDAFVNNLAVRLAPIFGKQASQDVKDAARDSFAQVKRANQRPRILGYDPAITGGGNVDWRTG